MSGVERLQRLMALLEAADCVPVQLPPAAAPSLPETTTTAPLDIDDEHEKAKAAAADPLGSISIETDHKIAEQEQITQGGNIPRTSITKTPADITNSFTTSPFCEHKGEVAPRGVQFSPFTAVTKYCYKFIHKDLKQEVASALFDGNKIYDTRRWDLYYISNTYSGVRTFIAEHQLQDLIDEINERFKTTLTITDEDRDNGLVIDFDELPDLLRPRWLGHCTSREQYQRLVDALCREPMMELNDHICGRTRLEEFKAKMDLAAEISKNKSAAKRREKTQQTIAGRQEMVKQSIRVQRYLGLHPKNHGELAPPAINADHLISPHLFDHDVIFIAIDVEANERASHQITEVGVATLDTRDLHPLAPGKIGKSWHSCIRGRHFRVEEYKHHVNSAFVQGCPNNFEFGTSEFVSKQHLPSMLTSCFHEPFSKPHTSTSNLTEPQRRNIVLVGHDLSQDISYCHKIGFSVLNRGNLIDTLDTAAMNRAYTRDPNAKSLGKILYDFDLEGWFLHNAGNDAVYTLQAMLAICVTSAEERGKPEQEERLKEALKKRTEMYVQHAEERAQDETIGWDLAEKMTNLSVEQSEKEKQADGGVRMGSSSNV